MLEFEDAQGSNSAQIGNCVQREIRPREPVRFLSNAVPTPPAECRTPLGQTPKLARRRRKKMVQGCDGKCSLRPEVELARTLLLQRPARSTAIFRLTQWRVTAP